MRLRGLVGAGLSLPLLGSLSATYAIETRYGGADTRRLSLIYTRQLFRNLRLTASISHTEERAVRDEVLVGFTWLMDSRHITTLASRVEEGRATTTATLQRSPPLGTGAGYRVAVEAATTPGSAARRGSSIAARTASTRPITRAVSRVKAATRCGRRAVWPS